MRIYTSIGNENGKEKGLGGNEYLDIDVRVGNSLLTSFTLRRGPSPDTEGVEAWVLYDENDEPIHWIEDKAQRTAQ